MRLSGRPDVSAKTPIIAIITPVEPRSLSSLATTTPIMASTISRGCNVFLLSAISPLRIRSTKNVDSQIISVNLIISATWNDNPPICIQRVAPFTSSPATCTAIAPMAVSPIKTLRDFLMKLTGRLLARAKAAKPRPMAITCLVTK